MSLLDMPVPPKAEGRKFIDGKECVPPVAKPREPKPPRVRVPSEQRYARQVETNRAWRAAHPEKVAQYTRKQQLTKNIRNANRRLIEVRVRAQVKTEELNAKLDVWKAELAALEAK